MFGSVRSQKLFKAANKLLRIQLLSFLLVGYDRTGSLNSSGDVNEAKATAC